MDRRPLALLGVLISLFLGGLGDSTVGAAEPFEVTIRPVIDCKSPPPSKQWIQSIPCSAIALHHLHDPGGLMSLKAATDSQQAALVVQLKFEALSKMLKHLRFRAELTGKQGDPIVFSNRLLSCFKQDPELRKTSQEVVLARLKEPLLPRYLKESVCLLKKPESPATSSSCPSLAQWALPVYYSKNDQSPGLPTLLNEDLLLMITREDPALGESVPNQNASTVLEAIAKLEFSRQSHPQAQSDPTVLYQQGILYLQANQKVSRQILADMEAICSDHSPALVLNESLTRPLLLNHPEYDKAYCELFRDTSSLLGLSKTIQSGIDSSRKGIGGAMTALFVGSLVSSGFGTFAAPWFTPGILLGMGLDLSANKAEHLRQGPIQRLTQQGSSMRTDPRILSRMIEESLLGADQALINNLIETALSLGIFQALERIQAAYVAHKLSARQVQSVVQVLTAQ